jgi:flavorubredoxin
MTVTNAQSGTNVHEIADRIYRINTPVALPGDAGAFSFNQYLVDDDDPLLFHTGPRRLFPLVLEAMASVMPVARLRHVAFSHVEADECGALNQWLAAAPQAAPLCGTVAAMVSIGDLADRPPRALADGEAIALGRHRVRWFDAPHVPHGWECGFLMEEHTATLLCGDLLTQPGHGLAALSEDDILGPSEAFRQQMDYYAHGPNTGALLERLAQANPRTLACMHGSAWRGDGAGLLRALAVELARQA